MTTLLTVEEAASELGTPVRFVRRLVQERRIRFHKIGKYVRIRREDLDAYVDASGVDPWPVRRSASRPLQPNGPNGPNGPNVPLSVPGDA